MSPPFHKNILIGPSVSSTVCCLRAELHLTKAELATKSGLSVRTIQDIEAGRKSRVQEKTLILLAEALEVEVAELLGTDSGDPRDPNGESAYNNGLNMAPRRAPLGRGPILLIASLVIVAVAAIMLWNWSHTHPT